VNNRQTVFVAEYLKDFNATQAAIRAGYSAKTAYSIGQRLLKDVETDASIKAAISERIMGKDEVLTRLADIARGDVIFVCAGKPR
jgi:phage terminase small subunit